MLVYIETVTNRPAKSADLLIEATSSFRTIAEIRDAGRYDAVHSGEMGVHAKHQDNIVTGADIPGRRPATCMSKTFVHIAIFALLRTANDEYYKVGES
jgi:hypothetical protein